MTTTETTLSNMLKLSQHANDALQGAVNRRVTEALEELAVALQALNKHPEVSKERIEYSMQRLKGLIHVA